MQLKRHALALALAGISAPASVWATNGMNLEGYGPIASAMGGASFAYDNGTAAVMNNPATLGLMAPGSRLDLAIGMLGPDVTAKCTSAPCAGASAESDGDSYFMPAVGYVRKQDRLTFGLAVFAQGGMGTDYSKSSFLAGGNNVPTRSELGVGRVIAPLTYNVNDNLTVGGSLDFVWAMLDIQMVANAAQVKGMTGGLDITTRFGADSAYLSFSDSNDFTGKAKGTGWAGKLGFTYKVSPTFSIGGTYHSKTNLDDLETDSGAAEFSLYKGGAPWRMDDGKIKVRDFQWPETYGLGVAWQATPALMLAADIQHIGWKDVMDKFRMTYSSAAFGTVNMTMPQEWDDQTVYSIGLSYAVNDALTLRAGANLSDNPIPDEYLNPLFPAIVENHYTIGFGYAFNKISDVNFSLMYAPEVDATSPAIAGVQPSIKNEHSQLSWQLMYTHRF